MGCVISICQTGSARRLGNCPQIKEGSGEIVLDDGNEVRIENDAVTGESLSVESVQNAVSFSAPERRRSSPRVGLSEQQVWPPWLLAVAGEAIREWKPRRANTFQKIDKVSKVMTKFVKSFQLFSLLLILIWSACSRILVIVLFSVSFCVVSDWARYLQQCV